jgi:hypothetical protein
VRRSQISYQEEILENLHPGTPGAGDLKAITFLHIPPEAKFDLHEIP